MVLLTAPLVARAQGIATLTLSPATITGGSGGLSTGTVTLSAPAPAGGQVVTLTSSNTDLAASTPSIVVPEGATSASFTVGTNPAYRPNSGLAFDAVITASDGGSSASAILHVTAQAIRSPVSGSTQSFQEDANAGTICSGTYGGPGALVEQGNLYQCKFPAPGVNNNFSICTFLQECAVGCSTTSPPFVGNLGRKDVCITTPPFLAALNPEIVEGGRRSAGTVVLDRPAPSLTSAFVGGGWWDFLFDISPAGFFPIPPGATTVPFKVDTLEVAVPMFLPVEVGFSTPEERHYRNSFIAVAPAAGSGPPAGPLALFSLNLTSARNESLYGGVANQQGDGFLGTVILNGVAPSGGAVVSLASDNPAAIVAPAVTVPAGQTTGLFGVDTMTSNGASLVAAPTPVTVTASFGGECRSAAATISPFMGPRTGPFIQPALLDLTLDSATVIAGDHPTGRVTLTSPAPDPASGFVTVALTSDNEAAVLVSRDITVGFGGIIGDFTIRTFPVATPTLVTITGTYNGVTRSATLTVNPPGSTPPPPAASAICLNPTALIGGNASIGIVSLDRPAPAGGVAVTLSTDNAVAIVPASITVSAGQTTVPFQISTTAVITPTVIRISASAGGVTKSARLTAKPVPPPPLSSLTVNPTTVAGGNPVTGTVTLASPAPAGGSVIALAAGNNPVFGNFPRSVTIAAGGTTASFTITTFLASFDVNAGICATLGASMLCAGYTVTAPQTPAAPSLISPAVDATPAQPVTFDWTDVANAAGYEIQIANSSTFTPPLTVSQTASASLATISGLPAQRLWWRVRASNSVGVFGPFSATQRFTPQAAPPPPAVASLSAVSVSPASVVGGTGATGTVTLTTAAPSGGFLVNLSTSNAAVASLPASVTVAAGATSASFAVTTNSVAISTAVTITATGGGVTRTATLTVNLVPPPASLSSITLSPATVTGGGPATGTATLTSAAPSGGLLVTLSSSNTAIGTVPASVTIAAGATSASFAVTTNSVTSATAITITGSGGGAIRTATLTVNPQAAGALLTLTATGRAGETVSSSPAGIAVKVGTTGSASFTTGTVVTLSVTNQRDAIWSGGCSSGGVKVKTCSFTINAATSVTANVQ